MQIPTVPLADNVRMPLLGLGTWQLRGSRAREAVVWALEAGYRHFDTATVYRNEAELGAALRESSMPRRELFVTTKLPPHEAGNERGTLERSLQALDTDRVDLWLIHWPPRGSGVSTWQALIELARQGLARAIGVSNYTPTQIDELIDKTGVAPAVNQIKWSPFLFDRGRLEHSRSRGVVLEGYSPFKASRLKNRVLRDIAASHRKSPAQVIIRWHLEHGIPVIPKSAHRDRIVSNFDVFDFSLDAEELAALDGLSNRR